MVTSVTDSGDDDSIAATWQMCTYCFDVLMHHHLHPSSEHSSLDITFNSTQYNPPNVQCPLFVTWEKTSFPPLQSKVSSGLNTSASSSIIDETSSTHNYNTDTHRYELRGCIGTLAPKQLSHALSEFAITSALHDRRFDPISLHELPFLRVGVSLLVNYEQCLHCFDWIVGVHGIIIKFAGDDTSSNSSSVRGMEQHYYSATFLPEVAEEQSWDQKETILCLIRKAGYRGNITNEMLFQIQCTRYQSSKCKVSYQEYVAKCHDGEDPLRGSSSAVSEEERRTCRLRSNTCVTL